MRYGIGEEEELKRREEDMEGRKSEDSICWNIQEINKNCEFIKYSDTQDDEHDEDTAAAAAAVSTAIMQVFVWMIQLLGRKRENATDSIWGVRFYSKEDLQWMYHL